MTTKGSSRLHTTSAASSSSSSSSQRGYHTNSFGGEQDGYRNTRREVNSNYNASGKQSTGLHEKMHQTSRGSGDLSRGKFVQPVADRPNESSWGQSTTHRYRGFDPTGSGQSHGIQSSHPSHEYDRRYNRVHPSYQPAEALQDYGPVKGFRNQSARMQSEFTEHNSRLRTTNTAYNIQDQSAFPPLEASRDYGAVKGLTAMPQSEGILRNGGYLQTNSAYSMQEQSSFPPLETSKGYGTPRGNWDLSSRSSYEAFQKKGSGRSTKINDPDAHRRVQGNFPQQDSYILDGVMPGNQAPLLSSAHVSTGAQSEIRSKIADANTRKGSRESFQKPHQVSGRGWEPSDESYQASSRGWDNPARRNQGGNTGWENFGVSSIRRQGHSHSFKNVNSHPENRDLWRQNSSREASSINSETTLNKSLAKQNEKLRESASFTEQKLKQTGTFVSSTVVHKFGNTEKNKARVVPAAETRNHQIETNNAQNSIETRRHEGEDDDAMTPKKHSLSVHADIDASEEASLPFIMGLCEDMCPAKERDQRERLRDLAVFERLNGNPRKTSKELAVKKFCRTFSGLNLHPSDVRPLPVLWSTLQYLFNLLDDHEFSFDVVHNFLFDRTRAIRQELGMQRIANSQAITMYEEIVRFHILSEYELRQRGSGRHTSDLHLNLQQLSKSLLSLFSLYDLKTCGRMENEPEFRAYYVLLNVGNLSQHQMESLSIWFRVCPAALMKTPELKFARKVLRYCRLGDFKSFFQMVLDATFLQGCLMELHFNEVRLKALAAINQGGYKLHPIPLSDIAKLLAMKEGDLEELCTLCGLTTGHDVDRVRCLLVKQSQFSPPDNIPYYRCPSLASKKGASLYKEVTRGNLKST